MRPRFGVALAGAAIVLPACGGGATGAGADADRQTVPIPADGPPPSLPVSAASIDSPLPDVAVRRINGDGGWVQFKNLLPADRPVLVWFWAPH